jgi:hypothetical protein
VLKLAERIAAEAVTLDNAAAAVRIETASQGRRVQLELDHEQASDLLTAAHDPHAVQRQERQPRPTVQHCALGALLDHGHALDEGLPGGHLEQPISRLRSGPLDRPRVRRGRALDLATLVHRRPRGVLGRALQRDDRPSLPGAETARPSESRQAQALRVEVAVQLVDRPSRAQRRRAKGRRVGQVDQWRLFVGAVLQLGLQPRLRHSR